LNILSKLWSAVHALVAALHGLAETVNTINAEVRLRVGIEDPALPTISGDNGHAERPALVKGRKGKGEP
jgi:hypothetical protein